MYYYNFKFILNTHSEQQMGEKKLKQEESFRKLWDNMKSNNICIIEVAEREESKQEMENLFGEKFPNLVKEKVTQIQETESQPRWISKDPHLGT